MLPGKATPEGTAAYAKGHSSLHEGHWRAALGLTVSSIGMGTYLGNADPVTDAKYEAAAGRALGSGINVIDSAINYRFQRSERSVGEALRKGGVPREGVILCTKGGFVPGDTGPPTREWFEETYLKPGIITVEDIVAGGHCMTPAYLKHELDRSRKNLGVETLDVYYVHNPEMQLTEIGAGEFYTRLTAAFGALEECVADGRLQWYGMATWDAFRVPPEAPGHVSMEKAVACAVQAGGEGHHFRVVQFPYNPALGHAYRAETQERGEIRVPALRAASDLGLTVFTSVPLMQTKLLDNVPRRLRPRFPGLATDAQRCLQFARSTPGVTAPLCGTKTLEHLDENLKVASVPPLSGDAIDAIFSGGE